jgi:hypothetical protein
MTRENTLTPFEIMHQNEKLNTGGYDYKRGFLDATQIAKDIYTETQNDLLEALEGLVESCELFGRDVEDAKKAIAKARGES